MGVTTDRQMRVTTRRQLETELRIEAEKERIAALKRIAAGRKDNGRPLAKTLAQQIARAALMELKEGW